MLFCQIVEYAIKVGLYLVRSNLFKIALFSHTHCHQSITEYLTDCLLFYFIWFLFNLFTSLDFFGGIFILLLLLLFCFCGCF